MDVGIREPEGVKGGNEKKKYGGPYRSTRQPGTMGVAYIHLYSFVFIDQYGIKLLRAKSDGKATANVILASYCNH